MESKEIITARNLSAGHKDKTVWNQANFSILSGEFTAVVGPNGAGKTTLFQLLLGLIKPLGGSLSIFGQSPNRGNRRIGYIPQRHQIDTESNIEAAEFISLGINGHKWGFSLSKYEDDEIRSVLELVEGETLAHRRLGSMSGGELQRIFLAQALIGNPDLLLLDEPLSNLDIKRESNFIQLINKVVRTQGVSALLIAHNITPLLPYLDKIIYLANGQVATGRPDEVLTSEILSKLYDAKIEVLRDSRGRVVIAGAEESPHHHD